MKLREVKKFVSELSFQQLTKLDAWLHSLMEMPERAGSHKSTGRTAGRRTYRSEMVRCGKKGCKCADGKLHGPYWYAYWFEGGKTKSQYIGKRLPKGVKPPRDKKAQNV